MILMPVLFLVTTKLLYPGLLKTQSDAVDLVATNLLIAGLFLITLSKDKVEDELIMLLRLKAMGIAFGIAIIYVIMDPLFSLIWGEQIKELNGSMIIMNMLFVYIVFFFLLKKMR